MLRRLRPSKAAGPDGVFPGQLEACALELGNPLQHIFDLSLEQGRVPHLWKTTCIVPLPKRPKPEQLNDFGHLDITCDEDDEEVAVTPPEVMGSPDP